MAVESQRVSRLLVFLLVIAPTLYLTWEAPTPATAKDAKRTQTVDLTPHIAPAQMQHVKVLFELDGTLALKTESAKPVKAPVRAKAHLIYSEKVLEGGTAEQPWAHATARYYETAKATIQFPDENVSPMLRDDRLIVATTAPSANEVTLFSPLGPLSRDELDLLNVPASSAILDSLLPCRKVSVGQSWNLESQVLPAFLGVDAVNRQEIKCTFDRIDGNLAIIHAQGSASAASGGVATEITLAAKYSFDMTLQRISWFAMSLKENRSIGHAQPGIEATVRIQMALTKRSNVPTLHDNIISDLNMTADDTARLVEFSSSAGGFELLLSRDWHEMVDNTDYTVLRFVERGDLIAQVNISSLPPREDGVPFTMLDFQKDVKTALDTNFGEIAKADEVVNDNGLHVMRVAAIGKISDLAINWIYYHVSDAQGRRASCVFTYESDLEDRFGAIDQAAISSFQFREDIAISTAARPPK